MKGILLADPAPEAAQRWIEGGLLAGLELTWAKALLDISSEAASLIDEAKSDRIIEGNFSLVEEFTDFVSPQGFSRTDEIPLDRLRSYLVREKLPALIRLQGEQLDSFAQAAERITEKATLAGWDRAKYVDTIERLASLYGADGFRSYYADVWYNTYVVNAAYNEAQLEILLNSRAGSLFPFVRLETKEDERVRDSHAKIHGLTARATWSGWARFTPPLDWNCRCKLRKINWQQARALGFFQRIPEGSSLVLRKVA